MKDFPTLSLPRKAFVKPSRHNLESSFRQGWNMVNADLDWYPEGSIHWCLEWQHHVGPLSSSRVDFQIQLGRVFVEVFSPSAVLSPPHKTLNQPNGCKSNTFCQRSHFSRRKNENYQICWYYVYNIRTCVSILSFVRRSLDVDRYHKNDLGWLLRHFWSEELSENSRNLPCLLDVKWRTIA